MSEDEIKNLSKVFLDLDKDGDGQLSYEELVLGLKEHMSNYAELLNIYEKSFDKSQKINYNEFIASTLEL